MHLAVNYIFKRPDYVIVLRGGIMIRDGKGGDAL
jgi:hypothetical protein